jgi:hypothetical protein
MRYCRRGMSWSFRPPLKIRRNQASIFDNQNLLFARPLFLTHGDVLGVYS